MLIAYHIGFNFDRTSGGKFLLETIGSLMEPDMKIMNEETLGNKGYVTIGALNFKQFNNLYSDLLCQRLKENGVYNIVELNRTRLDAWLNKDAIIPILANETKQTKHSRVV